MKNLKTFENYYDDMHPAQERDLEGDIPSPPPTPESTEAREFATKIHNLVSDGLSAYGIEYMQELIDDIQHHIDQW